MSNKDKLKKSELFSEVLPDLQWVSGALNNNNESGCLKEDISKPQEKKNAFLSSLFLKLMHLVVLTSKEKLKIKKRK